MAPRIILAPGEPNRYPKKMHLFRALKYKNYRLFFIGQSISLVGTWMQHVALAWLVYRLTGSAFWLGLLGFAGHIPNFLFAPVAGVLADRWNKIKILHITQTLSLVQAVVLAWFVIGGFILPWQLIVFAAVLGVINAADIPTRQAFFVDLVGNKKDLGNAIALNSSMFNFARLLGPALAGILIALKGEGICFVVNAVSFLPIIFALLFMKVLKRKRVLAGTPVWHGLKEGVHYIWKFTPIRDILLLLAFVGLIGMPFTLLFPIVAKEILNGGPELYGFLVAAAGVGALAGALTLASKKDVLGFEKLIAVCSFLFGLSLIAFSQSRELILSMVILFFAGFTLMIQMASTNTVLQTIVEDDKRGRLMSFFSLSIIGTAPFGHLLVGALANSISTQATLLICGIACIAGALFFTRRLPQLKKKMHPVYVKMGLIPEVVSGIQSATNLTAPPED